MVARASRSADERRPAPRPLRAGPQAPPPPAARGRRPPGLAQAPTSPRPVPPQPGELPPALDLELSGNCHRRPGARTLAAQLRSYLRLVQHRMRQPVVIYLGHDFADRYRLPMLYHHPLWLRQILRRPPRGWAIWQVDGNAHIDGINGDVALDVGRLNLIPGQRSFTPYRRLR